MRNLFIILLGALMLYSCQSCQNGEEVQPQPSDAELTLRSQEYIKTDYYDSQCQNCAHSVWFEYADIRFGPRVDYGGVVMYQQNGAWKYKPITNALQELAMVSHCVPTDVDIAMFAGGLPGRANNIWGQICQRTTTNCEDYNSEKFRVVFTVYNQPAYWNGSEYERPSQGGIQFTMTLNTEPQCEDEISYDWTDTVYDGNTLCTPCSYIPPN